MKNILEVKAVNQKIQDDIILDKITFNVEDNSIIGLFGPNGVGKSTLLRKIANCEITDGDIYINGIANDFTKFRTDVMLVTSDIDIPRSLTLNQYCSLLELSFDVDKAFVKEYAQKLDINLNKRISTFSKGNREMAQLIACFATHSNLILLDEPLSAIDIYKRDTVLEMIIDSKLNGKTIIITTHLIDDIADILDRVIYIHDTKIDFDLDIEAIQIESSSIADYLKNHFRGE
ncbi:ATP-binding cassette domain-containing protein [Mollicutes bacterium LVI A0039]|nr:ATP-binding cassette domain-containing protein [Mollicutes bacterium LVI A0039]